MTLSERDLSDMRLTRLECVQRDLQAVLGSVIKECCNPVQFSLGHRFAIARAGPECLLILPGLERKLSTVVLVQPRSLRRLRKGLGRSWRAAAKCYAAISTAHTLTLKCGLLKQLFSRSWKKEPLLPLVAALRRPGPGQWWKPPS